LERLALKNGSFQLPVIKVLVSSEEGVSGSGFWIGNKLCLSEIFFQQRELSGVLITDARVGGTSMSIAPIAGSKVTVHSSCS